MGSYTKKIKSILKHNDSGSTMVETLASFVVLFIVLAALYSIVVFSTQLYFRSVDLSRLNQKFFREIYKKDTDTSQIKKTEYIKGFGGAEGGKEHAALVLSFDAEKTSSENYENAKVTTSYMNLDKTGAETYVYIGPGSENENYVVPTAVMFKYDK